jgi:predicted transcriptional regulator
MWHSAESKTSRAIDWLHGPIPPSVLLGGLAFCAVILWLWPGYTGSFLSADKDPTLALAAAAALGTTILSYAVMKLVWKPDLYVMARIIRSLLAEGPMKRTNLYYKSGLNYTAFQRYLKWMAERDLIRLAADSEGIRVQLTQAGSDSFDALERFLSTLSPARALSGQAQHEPS